MLIRRENSSATRAPGSPAWSSLIRDRQFDESDQLRLYVQIAFRMLSKVSNGVTLSSFRTNSSGICFHFLDVAVSSVTGVGYMSRGDRLHRYPAPECIAKASDPVVLASCRPSFPRQTL
jgi:hypothetical protein